MVQGYATREQWLFPTPDDEPKEWLASTLQPLCKGDVIIRDVRVLHGGTPNRTDETRFLPSLEFALKSFWESKEHCRWPSIPSLPQDLLEQFPLYVQSMCRDITAPRADIDVAWVVS